MADSERDSGVMHAREEEGQGILDLLIVLAKFRKMILSLMLGAALAAAIISFSLPKIYTGTATILPPQQAQSTAMTQLSGQLGLLAGLAGVSVGAKKNSELFISMLKSRSVADKLIARFNLRQVYDDNLVAEARESLEDATRITASKEGVINIEVDDRNPRRAAAMANAYVEELTALTQSLAVTEASRRRIFFEKQVKLSRDDLSKAELSLKQTQETTGLVQLGSQAQAIIGAIAKLKAQIVAKEVEIGAMLSFATERNPDLVIARNELAGMRRQLEKSEKANVADGGVLVPTGNIPAAGLEYMRRLREVKYHEAVFELMAKQYEIARVDEAKDHALIQTLDKAEIPERKSKPKRLLIIVLSTLLAGVVGMFIAVVREAIACAGRDPLRAERLHLLRRLVSE